MLSRERARGKELTRRGRQRTAVGVRAAVGVSVGKEDVEERGNSDTG